MKAATQAEFPIVTFKVFQSTPPVKAATYRKLNRAQTIDISIHAAREGGDVLRMSARPKFHLFQSTPPVKAATRLNLRALTAFFISIHAAREGGDLPAFLPL